MVSHYCTQCTKRLEVLLVVEESCTTGSTLLVADVAALVQNVGKHLRATEEDTNTSPACRGEGERGGLCRRRKR